MFRKLRSSLTLFAQASRPSHRMRGSHPTLHRRVRIQDAQWDKTPLLEADLDTELDPYSIAALAAIDEAAYIASLAARGTYLTESERGPLENISRDIVKLFQDPGAIVVTLPALLLFEDQDRPLVQHLQGGQLASPIESLWSVLEGLQADERIALLDLCRNTVAELNEKAAEEILAVVDDLTDAAGETAWDLQAWRSLIRSSRRQPGKMPRAKIGKLSDIFRDLVELMSIMSVAAESDGLAEFRFHRAWARLGLPQAGVLPADVLAWPDLDETLRKVAHTPAAIRQQIAEACVAALTADGRLDATQAAMTRVVCERLGQPDMGLLPGRVSLS